jgi:hypothetical protein
MLRNKSLTLIEEEKLPPEKSRDIGPSIIITVASAIVVSRQAP